MITVILFLLLPLLIVKDFVREISLAVQKPRQPTTSSRSVSRQLLHTPYDWLDPGLGRAISCRDS